MKNILKYLPLLLLNWSVIACSEEKLTAFTTYDNNYSFELNSRFKATKPDLDIFKYGSYTINIDIYPKAEHIQKINKEYQNDLKKKYTEGAFRSFERIPSPVQNDQNYPIMAFYGGGRDRSVFFWPTYYKGYLFKIETPKHFVTIKLEHTGMMPNSIDKEQALGYIIPMIKSFRY